ncbi:hypothetical protein GY45DRAFT_1263589 [Cubamyces sp. BRFM 1775]|nr:hypothetical protein GY45DRAFT_1263589 [Cubamyces sp. BRFM 1775]
MRWFYSGSVVKSARELDRLVNEVILAEDFQPSDFLGFSAKKELERMDTSTKDSGVFAAKDGWRTGSVRISLPKTHVKHPSEVDAPTFEVNNIYYRPFLASIKAAYEDLNAIRYHNIPFKLYYEPPASADDPSASPSEPAEPERLYSEVYNTDALNRLNDAVQDKARNDREPGDSPDLEYAVAGTMLYSDSTSLASFGTASLWPIYFWLSSLSKYIRALPTAFAAHHLAYIPSLPDLIRQAYEIEYGSVPTPAVLRFCKKELMQKIWLLLLDDDFMHAYVHGFVVKCGDGITRRLFPRILTYSADYPEKCLIACIKYLGRCPCPSCLIDKSRIQLMGTKRDMAQRIKKLREDTPWLRMLLERIRGWIFQRGRAPEGKSVEEVLGSTSTSPNQSAFSQRLGELGFDIYRALVPDLMHEFELGVWKSTVTHLVRILTAFGASSINKLNARFTAIPRFGRDAIRHFGDNVAGLKKLAARDYEDLVQCAIPAFEGLLPAAHDRIIRRMLFQLATWHALAKLRLHSDSTLSVFENVTSSLGEAMRAFASKVCPAYDTRELDKEVAARQRRKGRKTTRGKVTEPSHNRAQKVFNLNTYKFHRLGDYVREVRETGTLDNTSTQTGELEHQRVKRFYVRTSKNARFQAQIGNHERRERLVHRDRRSSAKKSKRPKKSEKNPGLRVPRGEAEAAAPCLPGDHHSISDEQRHHIDLTGFVHDCEGDPANFASGLRRHVLRRLLKDTMPDGDAYEPTYEDFSALRLRHNRLYIHKRMLVNYTSYDMRRDQDTINPSSQCNVLLAAPPGSQHPYMYAQVLGIFHVNAYITGRGKALEVPTLLHILWVRWYNFDENTPWGLHASRLPRVEFAPLDDQPFGFLSPNHVIRGVHLIPAFAHGRSDEALPGHSIARANDGDDGDDDDEDWRYHYVGIFSDRDLFMRYLGASVGHCRPEVEAEFSVQNRRSPTHGDDPESSNVFDSSDDESEPDSSGRGGEHSDDADGETTGLRRSAPTSDEDEGDGDDEGDGGDDDVYEGFAPL